jgi:serine/threonine protein kinase
MPDPEVEKFLADVRQSGLIADADWPRVTHLGGGARDSQDAGNLLVAEKLLSRWQVKKLLAGRHRGFFLGKYKLIDLIGAGGMSRVYLAEHTLMRRRVAIKVLPLRHAEDPQYRERFLREARVAALLRHPNIIQVYDLDQDGKIHYLVMEYLEGSDLQRLVRARGPLPAEQAAEIIRQAALGLHHAHEARLVHRDVKPANLLVDKLGNVKVLDLGLALYREARSNELTAALGRHILGTADYIAPEQTVDSHAVEPRADIYSLGCALYFALTGGPPFPEGTTAEKLRKHQRESPRRIQEARPDIDVALTAICERMMAKDPEERFPSASAAALALQAWLETARHSASQTENSTTILGPINAESESQPMIRAPELASDTPLVDQSGGKISQANHARVARMSRELDPSARWLWSSIGVMLIGIIVLGALLWWVR